MERNSLSGFGIGLLTGAIIGGVIALLYAPKSGSKTRQLIRDSATEFVDTVKEETIGVVDTVKDGASEAVRRGQAAVHALKG